MPPQSVRAARLRQRFVQAQVLHQRGMLAEAAAIYREILKQDPRHADAMHFLGLIALQTDKPRDGIALIRRAIAVKPDYPEALGNLGNGYASIGSHQDALACFDKALALRPDLAEVHDNRGSTLRDLGRPREALASHDKALALRPDDAGALSNRGNALRDLQRYQEALDSYDRALSLQPGFFEIACNRAIVLSTLGRREEALAGFDGVIAMAPSYPPVHYARGDVLRELGRPEAALASFDRAIMLHPAYAEAHNGRGNALCDLRQHQEALASYGTAIDLVPTYAAAHYNLGNTLMALQREVEALPAFDRAIALKPDDANAHRCRGLGLYGLKRYREALVSFEEADLISSETDWLLGELLSTRRQICDWSAKQPDLDVLEKQIASGGKAAAPFTLTALSGSPTLHRRAAEIFVDALYPAKADLPPVAGYPNHEKIRVAYLSADFHDHPMMHVMIGLFGCHDRSRFELTALSLGPDTEDEWRQRAARSFDSFIDVRAMSDRDVALLARRLEIDIAVDLMGFTRGGRTGILAHRIAPVQVAYLGYPGTMGASYIDYMIADGIVIPPGDEPHYTEKVIRLPDSYQVNDRDRPVSPRRFTRADAGLPETGFVFCCFNNTYKIAPDIFDGWMRILHRVEGSVLWLYAENPDAAANLRQEAAARGVAAERLVFAQRLPMAEHLARQRLADLFLDTLPYNGHATASLALWSGLPVLTRLGDSFAGRVGASLLHAIALPDLVTTSQDGYEALAVDVATHPDRLQAIKARLEANRLTTPLFDTIRFTRHLEAAYGTIHARAQAGQPPAGIEVEALRDPETAHR